MNLTVLDKQIYERFIRPAVDKQPRYVGVEFELPLVNLFPAPVDFSVVHALVDAFLKQFHFQSADLDDDAHICSAQSEETGDELSFDCSYNTLELSFGRVENLNRIEERFRRYYAFIRSFLRERGHSITGMGLNPRYLYNHREPVPNGRYRMLYNHLNSYPRYANQKFFHDLPFFGMIACSSQTHIDVTREELVRVIELYNRLEPLKALLFANSPYGNEYLCARDYFWRCSMHGVNPHNVDGWDYGVSTVEEIVAYIRSMSLFCTERNGKYINFPPTPLVDYFNSASITGEYWDAEDYKSISFTPRPEDLRFLRSYKFVDLTFRGTVELRSACMQPVSEIMSVPAFDLGCKMAMEELEPLLRSEGLYQQGYSPSELRELFVRQELPGFVEPSELRRLLEQVVTLAEQGLIRRGMGEEHMLHPLKERARHLSNPALELVQGLKQGRTIEQFIDRYGQLEGLIPMLHNENSEILNLRRVGKIGLELESQRIDPTGRLSRTRHPFSSDSHIVRDFGEAQLEINTIPAESPEAALESLHALLGSVHHRLRERGELLWPFSNPPIIGSEEDIEIAFFTGEARAKYQYRRYLAQKYGKYQMTYSGIHFNYSFSEELLRKSALVEGAQTPENFRIFKDRFYLGLAEQVLSHSWVVVALLGASPLTDSSFFEAGRIGETVFSGSASLRSGPMGYWNHFTPVLSYEGMDAYADSIQRYIDEGMISQASELYYPVRLKSSGAYSLDGLRERGADHIELRMIDLNPFAPDGISLDDLRFLQLFLIWLASRPPLRLGTTGQLFALQNHKNAAAYDWSIIRIAGEDGHFSPLAAALDGVLREMEDFFAGDAPSVRSALAAQREKLRDQTRRYACRVRECFGEAYIRSGLLRAAEIQENFYV